MRICFLLISHWSANLGGAEQQVKYLADYISENTNHSLHYVCRRTKVLLDGKMVVHQIGSNSGLGKYLKCIDHRAIMNKLETIMPDVVYVRVWSSYLAVAAAYCQKYDKKLIHHIAHQDDVELFKVRTLQEIPKWIDRQFYLKGMAKSNHIIGQAAYQDELLERNYHRNCSLIIPNFHPVPETIAAKNTDKKKVIWVANIKKFKRPELFLKIAESFKDVDAEFLMIGAVNEQMYLEPIMAAERNLQNFKYLGQLPIKSVNQHLEEGYIFINTSTAEGFPNTFIQSWMRKTPVVSLNVDPDGVIEQYGMGYHSRSLEQMLKDIAHLLENPSLQEQMGERGREYAIGRFGIANCAKVLSLMEN